MSLKYPMRVAVFTETFLPKIDGIVSILCLMLKRFNELGIQVLLFAPAGAPDNYEQARIVTLRGPRIPNYPELRFNLTGSHVWSELTTFQPDLIHLVNPFFLGPPALRYAKRLNLPTVASFHTDLGRYAEYYGLGFFAPAIWAYLRSIHNRAHLNLCTSTFMRHDLQRRGFRRMRWWKRGIDTQLFSPGPADPMMRARLTDGHPEDFLVVNVGRQAPEKGLFEIRDAIFPSTNLPANLRLALVGGGPSHESLQEHYRNTPTVFPGYLRGAELVAAYRSADAFLFPSTTETFGLVALEAMACGLPVVAVKAGGVVDTVQDGYNGFFYEPTQLSQIRPLLQRLQHNPTFRAEMSRQAISHAQSRDWRMTMDQLADYYHLAQRLFRVS